MSGIDVSRLRMVGVKTCRTSSRRVRSLASVSNYKGRGGLLCGQQAK